MADIFISYANDDRERVAALAKEMEFQGLTVWWDRTLIVGEDFEKIIDDQIEAAAAVVACWSPSSVNSSWVRDESAHAHRLGKLCPVLLEPVDHIPKPYGVVHTADLTNWGGGDDPQLADLIGALRRRVDHPVLPKRRGKRRPKPRSRPNWWLRSAAAAVVTIAAVYGFETTFGVVDRVLPSPLVDGCEPNRIVGAVIAGRLSVDDAERLGGFCAEVRFAAADIGSMSLFAAPGAEAERTYAANFAAAVISSDPRERRAAAMEMQGRTDEAYALIMELAVESANSGGDAGEIRAVELWKRAGALAYPSDTDASLKAYDQARKLAPRDLAVLIEMARLYERSGEIDRARGLIDETLVWAPNCPEMWNVRGRVQLVLGDVDGAIASHEHALSLAADDPEAQARALNGIGAAHRTRADIDAAESHFRRALDVAKSNRLPKEEVAAIGNLGVIADERGDFGQADSLYRTAYEINARLGLKTGMAANLNNLGVVAERRGDVAGAEEHYREAIRISEEILWRTSLASSRRNLAAVLTKRGEADEAEEQYLEALEIDQSLGRQAGISASLSGLGKLAREHGDLTAAADFYERALAIDEGVGDALSAAQNLNGLGLVASRRDDAVAAEGFYRRALSIAERLQQDRFIAANANNLGNALRDQGKSIAACSAWRRARTAYVAIEADAAVERVESRLAQHDCAGADTTLASAN